MTETEPDKAVVGMFVPYVGGLIEVYATDQKSGRRTMKSGRVINCYDNRGSTGIAIDSSELFFFNQRSQVLKLPDGRMLVFQAGVDGIQACLYPKPQV